MNCFHIVSFWILKFFLLKRLNLTRLANVLDLKSILHFKVILYTHSNSKLNLIPAKIEWSYILNIILKSYSMLENGLQSSKSVLNIKKFWFEIIFFFFFFVKGETVNISSLFEILKCWCINSVIIKGNFLIEYREMIYNWLN